MRRAARSRLEAVGVEIDVDQPVGELSVGRRQIVAIAKALTYASRILIMDEPTAALTAAEVERLFKVMREIAGRGVGIVYISHRLEEVPRVADRVTVLRDGQVAGVASARAPQSELVRLLVGRPLNELYPRRSGAFGRRVLHLEGARYRPKRARAGWQAPNGVSLEVRAGEIVGLAGIMGAGRTELLTALYGAAGPGRWSGVVEIDGEVARLASIRDARGRGPRLRHRRPARQRPHAARQRRAEPGDVGFAQGVAVVPDVEAARGRARAQGDPLLRRPPGDAGGSRSGRFRAAISRRSSWPRRCSAAHGFCSSTSRRVASMSARRAKSTPASANSRGRGSAC